MEDINLSQMFIVSDMKNNILSVGRLLEKYYDIHMKNQSLLMRDQHVNLIANVAMRRNIMFLLNIQNDIKCLKFCANDSS